MKNTEIELKLLINEDNLQKLLKLELMQNSIEDDSEPELDWDFLGG